MLGGSKKQARAAREQNAAWGAERMGNSFYVAVHQRWKLLNDEVKPMLHSAGFAEVTEVHIATYLGYSSLPSVHAGVERGDVRPRMMQGMMVQGYLWRLAEERIGPASQPLGVAEAAELASSQWGSEIIESSSELWLAATFAWVAQQQGYRAVNPMPAGAFASPIAKDGYRSVQRTMQERLDYVWDEDGIYSYAFNFGYSLRYLEDVSNDAYAHPEGATEDDDAEELVAGDDDPPCLSVEGSEQVEMPVEEAHIAARTSPVDRFCTRCDSPEKIEGQFCGSCGAPAPADPPVTIARPDRYCGSCGRPRSEDARFCAGCGKALS